MLNAMTLSPHEIQPMNLGGSLIGAYDSLSCGITDGVKPRLLSGANTEIYMLIKYVNINEFSTAGVRCIEIRLVQTRRM
jgi:hypothetical protein